MEPRDPIPSFITAQQSLPHARAQRQRERLFRIFLWALAGFGGLIVLLLIAALRYDPNAHRPSIEAALRNATGREAHINGPMAITSWRHVTFAASKVTLANSQGGVRPEMLNIGHIEADLSLTSLLLGRIDIKRLVMEDAEILLETDARGRGNWQFGLPVSNAVPATPRPAPVVAPTRARRETPPPSRDAALVIRAMHLRDAHITWHDVRSGRTAEATLRRFTTSENPRDGNIAIGAELVVGSQPIVFNGTTGGIDRLLDPAVSGPPWGAVVTAEIPGLRLTVAGSFERPLEGAGYKLRIDGQGADTSGLASLLGQKLPPLHNMSLALQIADNADGVPEFSNLVAQIGSSDLNSVIPGLKIEQATLSARNGTDAMKLEAKGTATAADLRVKAEFGSLVDFLSSTASIPADITVSMGESALSVKGFVPTLRSDPRFDLSVQLRLTDLASLAPFVGHKLPAVRPITFAGRLARTEAGAYALRDGSLGMPQANIGADIDFTPGERPLLGLYLHGERLDVDALMTTFANVSFAPPSNEMPLGALPIKRSVRPIISDQKLGVEWMGAFDLDFQATLNSLTFGGMTGRSVSAAATIKDGHLIVRPVSGTLPGGPFDMTLDIDSKASPSPMAVTIKAPGLDMRPMLEVFGRTEDISGLLEIDADLSGTGASLHDLAGTARGHLGLSMVNGAIDNALLAPLLGGVMRAARVPSDLLFGPGRSRLRCFALRVDAENGHARVPALAMDIGRALIRGGGSFALGEETLDLRLRPLLRITANGISLPLKLTGRFRSPAITLDEGTAADAAVGSLSALSGRAIDTVSPDREADACPAALVIARGGNTAGANPAIPPPAPLLPNIRRQGVPAR